MAVMLWMLVGYGSKEITNLFNHFKWVWLGMTKVIENNDLAVYI